PAELIAGGSGPFEGPELNRAVGTFRAEGFQACSPEADRTNAPPAPAEEIRRAEPLAGGPARIDGRWNRDLDLIVDAHDAAGVAGELDRQAAQLLRCDRACQRDHPVIGGDGDVRVAQVVAGQQLALPLRGAG